MAYTINTRKLVEELKAILGANTDITFVSTGALTPLASETNDSAVYISVENIAANNERMNTNASGYDRHMLVNLYCNYDGTDDALGIYDFVDSVEQCILNDSSIWGNIVDRDLIAVEFDNQEHAPKRAVTLLFDLHFRIECN